MILPTPVQKNKNKNKTKQTNTHTHIPPHTPPPHTPHTHPHTPPPPTPHTPPPHTHTHKSKINKQTKQTKAKQNKKCPTLRCGLYLYHAIYVCTCVLNKSCSPQVMHYSGKLNRRNGMQVLFHQLSKSIFTKVDPHMVFLEIEHFPAKLRNTQSILKLETHRKRFSVSLFSL